MKHFTAVILASWISSCSFAEIAYNNLDWYMVWQVNKFIDLDASQERFITQAAEEYLSWHRAEELPKYRDLLSRIRTMASDSLTTDEVDSIYALMKERILVLMDSASDETADLLLSLTPEQIDGMEQRMKKNNRRWKKKDADEGSVSKKRTERVRDRAEDWIGRLTTSQSEWVMQYAAQMPSSTAHWLEHRRWRQKQLLQILRSRAETVEKKDAIRRWVTKPEDGRSEEYIKVEQDVREAWIHFIVELDRRLEPFQRKLLLENLTKYIRITDELTRKP